MDFHTKLNNALKEYHNRVYDRIKKQIKSEFKEDCNCPVCDSKEYSTYCIKDGYTHKRCSYCHLVYLSPRFNNKSTSDFYNSKANEIYNERKFHQISTSTKQDDFVNNQNLQIILNHIHKQPSNLKLLEIGSGNGFFLKKAKEQGFNVYGIELNVKLFERTKNISKNIYNQDLFERKFQDSLFDVIYMRDVIEHIPNPIPFMQELNRIAKNGCLIIFDTHNIDSLVNHFTKEYHATVFAFEHPVHWSSKSLTLAGKKVGFKHLKTYYEHGYQSISHILFYHLYPPFTFIFKPNNNSLSYSIKKILFRILKFRGISKLDSMVMKILSKLLKKGATMKVVFIK